MGACLGKEHEIGWEVEFEVAGITAREFMIGFHDEAKMNEVWRRVGMRGMHGMTTIQESTDGNTGGVGTIYESYDKKGVMQSRQEVVHYEIQDGGKSIYTELKFTDKGPLFPFKLGRDEDIQRMIMTDLDNGNVKFLCEQVAVFQGRGFCGCCIKLMYPMVKFQKSIQDVLAPKGDGSTVPRGKMTMKKELTYKTSRQVVGLLGVDQGQEKDIEIKINEPVNEANV